MNRYERRKQAIKEKLREHALEIKGLYDLESKEKRTLEQEERDEVNEHTKAIHTLEEELKDVEANIKLLDDVDRLGEKMGPPVGTIDSGVEFRENVTVGQHRPSEALFKSIGEQFVATSQFKDVQELWKKGRTQFSTGMIPVQTKGTLLEGTAGSGAGLVSVPQVIPGVVDTQFQRLTVADLLLTGQATTNSIRYVVEGTAVSGAAGVAEGGAKPQSTLGLDVVDDPVKKIATTLVVSDEMLEDVSQVQSYINGRLSLFVQIEEEDQLLRGAGTNDLYGLLNAARGINTRGTAGDTGGAFASLFLAMNGQRGSAKLEPDWIVLHPDNWATLRLTQDSNNQFYGGGPFMGQYGAGGQTGNSNQIQGPDDYLWGKRVLVTTAIGSGTALIGTRSGAQVFRRGGLSVEASNNGYVNGSDLFSSNLVQIRAEERLALCVYRPSSFTAVTL